MKYKPLRKGMMLREGDEWYYGPEWCKTQKAGCKIVAELTAYRRPIKSTGKQTTEQLVRKCFGVLVCSYCNPCNFKEHADCQLHSWFNLASAARRFVRMEEKEKGK
jgi:hypothetical protein